jgi:transposase
MSYSLDFRKRVFAIKKKENLTFEATSKRFHITTRTLFRWQKRIQPKNNRSKPATKIDMVALQKDVQENPDRFQYERAGDYGVSQGAIGFALKRLHISHKKNSISPQS